jgi:2-polyprenyl-3-methyl-5-hydroxy-6-metoxy-1,4-benzoquinol methylase
MKSGLERIVPDLLVSDEITGKKTLKLHLERYQFASRNIKPGRILDIACGVGYGCDLMLQLASDQITEIYCVDSSHEAIAYARQRYGQPKAFFIEQDAMKYFDPVRFDTIIALETIEHIQKPERFIQQAAGLLKPGGRFIASVPITPSVDINPYHITDFTEVSFRSLFKAFNLAEIALLRQVQPYQPFSIIAKKEARLNDLNTNLLSYYFKHPSSGLKRILAFMQYGFNNLYLTIVWEKRD